MRVLRPLALTLLAPWALPAAPAAPAPQAAQAPQALPAPPAPAPAPEALPGLEAKVLRALEAFQVPGAAVVALQDGRVVLERGFGRADLAGRPVTPATRFQVASNTKAFTAALLAQLVDEGRLRWEDRVSDLLPDFRLGGDPALAREVTVKDLLSHRTGLGLGQGDLLCFFGSTVTRPEILRRMARLEPHHGLRSRYAYANLPFLVAGEVAARLSGQPWEALVEARILKPLAMATATPLPRPSPEDARPTAVVEGRLQAVPMDDTAAFGPAAGIQASVHDLVPWLRVQLAKGDLGNGRRLFSEARSREMWEVATPIPPSRPKVPALAALAPRFAGYGLGWGLKDYRGVKLVSHAGALSGMLSRVMLVPERNLAVAVLTNGEGSAYDAIAYTVLDALLGAPPMDWTAALQEAERLERDQAAQELRDLEAARLKDTRPSLPLAAYAGTYEDPWLGRATLTLEGSALVLRLAGSPRLVADLSPWHLDTFKATWRDRVHPDALLTFQLDDRAKVDRLRLRALSPLADFSYDFQDLDLRPAPPSAPAP